jgi:uncharacterized protein (DUF1778 family)
MENKRERGRPPKKTAELHTERLEIRFTPDEAKALDHAADGKLATWARETLLRAARRRIK